MTDEKQWIRTVRCEDVPLREGRPFRIGDRNIAIFNLGDRFAAIDNRCPHMGAPLSDGFLYGPTTVLCPLHAYRIDVDTGLVTSPPNPGACTETFRTRLEDGAVWVEIPANPTPPLSPNRSETR